MGSGNSEEIRAKAYFQGEIGCSALVNKLGITDQQELEEVEAYFVENATMNGFSPLAKELTPNGLKRMHFEMFGDIYGWAGQYRDYTTGRGVPFCRPEFIEKSLSKIYRDLHNEIAPNMEKSTFVKSVAKFIGELNAIHPFVDGNGRTQRQVLWLIAEYVGFTLHINDSLNKADWYASAEQAHQLARYDKFETLIQSLIN
ncbi:MULTISPECIES: Fic/DOC family protein [unclassified Moraxella]|uniref:Fic/DOC family protein n=1 Tax=unclassified Moraxella TaxID=2685852 RepID=UPI003AF76FCE